MNVGDIYKSKVTNALFKIQDSDNGLQRVTLQNLITIGTITRSFLQMNQNFDYVSSSTSQTGICFPNIGDTVKNRLNGSEYEIIKHDIAQREYKIKCIKTRRSNELMMEYTVEKHIMKTDFILIKQGQKPLDKAYDKLMDTYKINNKGDRIHVDEWNKLYCSCDNRQAKTITILHESFKVCTNCNKEIID